MFTEIRNFLTLKKKSRQDIEEAVDFSETVRELIVYTINAKSSLGWIVLLNNRLDRLEGKRSFSN